MIASLVEILIAVLLFLGGVFGLVGSWGLVRLPDAMCRLHAPTKAATLGVGCVLIAAMLHHRVVVGEWSWHELLIFLFIAMTSPITALFLAKANMHHVWPRDSIPRPASGVEWSTYADPEADTPVTPPAAPSALPLPDGDRGWE